MNRARHGGTLKNLVVLLTVMMVGVFTWATIANSRRVGELCIRPNDIDWWFMSVPQGKQEGVHTQSIIDEAKHLADLAEDKLWGKGGVIERCEAWWQGRQGRSAPADDGASAERQRCEKRFTEAEGEFRSGLDSYKRAAPGAHGGATDKRAAALDARTRFLHAHDLLATTIPAYEALGDYDKARAKSAHQLLDYTQELLAITAAK